MDDPYYMTAEQELNVELRCALDRISLLERQLEDANMTISDLTADLRMVRSGRDGFSKLIQERGLRTPKETARLNAPRRQKDRGVIVNPHVFEHAPEPQKFPSLASATEVQR